MTPAAKAALSPTGERAISARSIQGPSARNSALQPRERLRADQAIDDLAVAVDDDGRRQVRMP